MKSWGKYWMVSKNTAAHFSIYYHPAFKWFRFRFKRVFTVDCEIQITLFKIEFSYLNSIPF